LIGSPTSNVFHVDLQTRRPAKAIVMVERDFENAMAVTNGFAADKAFHRGPGMIDFSHSCCLARAIPLQISHPGYWFWKRVAFKLGVGVHAYVFDVRYETILYRAGRRG